MRLESIACCEARVNSLHGMYGHLVMGVHVLLLHSKLDHACTPAKWVYCPTVLTDTIVVQVCKHCVGVNHPESQDHSPINSMYLLTLLLVASITPIHLALFIIGTCLFHMHPHLPILYLPLNVISGHTCKISYYAILYCPWHLLQKCS